MVDENPDPGGREGPAGVDPHHQEQTRGDSIKFSFQTLIWFGELLLGSKICAVWERYLVITF